MNPDNPHLSPTLPSFAQLILHGSDAQSFLQGQLTCNINKVGLSYQATAICNLKGRIEYGIWIKKHQPDQYAIVVSQDLLPSLQAHIQKYGAFAKFDCQAAEPVYACVLDGEATFTGQSELEDTLGWMHVSMATGNYWITAATQGMFQPQQLRLHQRGGVDYDKGCYLGQEVIARVYFKSAPKAFLHRVMLNRVMTSGDQPEQLPLPKAGDHVGTVSVVNVMVSSEDSQCIEALVVARPDEIADSGFQLLALPSALQADVARDRG